MNRRYCVLSLGSRHSVETQKVTTQTREKVCVWCVFDILYLFNRTQCLLPVAENSVWHHLITQNLN
jgi:hypothetical protein